MCNFSKAREKTGYLAFLERMDEVFDYLRDSHSEFIPIVDEIEKFVIRKNDKALLKIEKKHIAIAMQDQLTAKQRLSNLGV